LHLVRKGVCACAEHWRKDSGPDLEARHGAAIDPHELELRLSRAKGQAVREASSLRWDLNIEIETNFVKRRAGVSEEVFNHPQQFTNRDNEVEFFRELANQRIVRGLAGFDAPAGK